MATTPTAPEADTNAPATDELNIPVQTSNPEPLVVASEQRDEEPETPAAAEADGSDANPDRKSPPKLPEWAQKEMAKKAFEAREATRRTRELEEELARLKGGTAAPTPSPADAAAAQQNAPAGGYRSQAEFDAAVQAEAGRRANEARAAQEMAEFNAACDAAYAAGKGAFGDDFEAAAENLRQIGAMNRDLLDLALGMDDPAKIIFELGSDPTRAQSIMSLPVAKRAAEIAKMAVAAPKATPTPLSRAPRPVATVEGTARPSTEPSDTDDDATWYAKRNQQLRQRYSGAA